MLVESDTILAALLHFIGQSFYRVCITAATFYLADQASD